MARASHHTLQPTALVHEAYLRLTHRDALTVRDRTHFYAMAVQMMRQILIDHARKEQVAKRGGLAITLSLDEASDRASAAAGLTSICSPWMMR
jgi:RNA polymerase sigma factor (TIGR02999 family)